MRPLRLTLLLAVPPSLTYALRLPLQTRTSLSTPDPIRHVNSDLTRRATANSSTPLVNFENLEYIVNITLGGKSVAVSIDTGSSDLWVYGSVPNTQSTGKTASVGYAIGTVNGSVLQAPLGFAGYTVPDQAFINVLDVSTFSNDPTTEGYSGLVGLGPNTGSAVQGVVGGQAGGPMMDRIFELNTTSQNYISFQLSRDSDPGNSVVGQMTVSEPVPGFESILTQTKLDVIKVGEIELVKLLVGSPTQHWSTYTDANGVIGPDGNAIKVDSLAGKAPSNTLVAVFDSGFTLPQVSRSISDAIYGRVQGAVWNGTNGWWDVPCAQELNISFIFGGQTIPVHPLDTVLGDIGGQTLGSVNGVPMCVGAFQPIGEGAIDRFGSYDLILGMGFLRNAYILMDYGDFISETSTDKGDPFIQLLSVTNTASAHADFVKVRMGGVDTTGSSQYALLPANKGQHSPITLRERELFFEAKHLGAIIGGSIGGVVLIIGVVLWCCCCRRRKDGRRGLGFGKRTTMVGGAQNGGGGIGGLKSPFQDAHAQKYSSLDDPGPAEDYELKPSGYAPPNQHYDGSYRQ
ncbi:hypothetical protein FRB98_001692 [Tulasnella sp. 332]|nr:hypothetical protein FRB98_001692 [Tulasnella sp. 332]